MKSEFWLKKLTYQTENTMMKYSRKEAQMETGILSSPTEFNQQYHADMKYQEQLFSSSYVLIQYLVNLKI